MEIMHAGEVRGAGRCRLEPPLLDAHFLCCACLLTRPMPFARLQSRRSSDVLRLDCAISQQLDVFR